MEFTSKTQFDNSSRLSSYKENNQDLLAQLVSSTITNSVEVSEESSSEIATYKCLSKNQINRNFGSHYCPNKSKSKINKISIRSPKVVKVSIDMLLKKKVKKKTAVKCKRPKKQMACDFITNCQDSDLRIMSASSLKGYSKEEITSLIDCDVKVIEAETDQERQVSSKIREEYNNTVHINGSCVGSEQKSEFSDQQNNESETVFLKVQTESPLNEVMEDSDFEVKDITDSYDVPNSKLPLNSMIGAENTADSDVLLICSENEKRDSCNPVNENIFKDHSETLDNKEANNDVRSGISTTVDQLKYSTSQCDLSVSDKNVYQCSYSSKLPICSVNKSLENQQLKKESKCSNVHCNNIDIENSVAFYNYTDFNSAFNMHVADIASSNTNTSEFNQILRETNTKILPGLVSMSFITPPATGHPSLTETDMLLAFGGGNENIPVAGDPWLRLAPNYSPGDSRAQSPVESSVQEPTKYMDVLEATACKLQDVSDHSNQSDTRNKMYYILNYDMIDLLPDYLTCSQIWKYTSRKHRQKMNKLKRNEKRSDVHKANAVDANAGQNSRSINCDVQTLSSPANEVTRPSNENPADEDLEDIDVVTCDTNSNILLNTLLKMDFRTCYTNRKVMFKTNNADVEAVVTKINREVVKAVNDITTYNGDCNDFAISEAESKTSNFLETLMDDILPETQRKWLQFVFVHDMLPPINSLYKLAKMMGCPGKLLRNWFVEARKWYKRGGLRYRPRILESCSYCQRPLYKNELLHDHLFDAGHVKAALGDYYLEDKTDAELVKIRAEFQKELEKIKGSRALASKSGDHTSATYRGLDLNCFSNIPEALHVTVRVDNATHSDPAYINNSVSSSICQQHILHVDDNCEVFVKKENENNDTTPHPEKVLGSEFESKGAEIFKSSSDDYVMKNLNAAQSEPHCVKSESIQINSSPNKTCTERSSLDKKCLDIDSTLQPCVLLNSGKAFGMNKTKIERQVEQLKTTVVGYRCPDCLKIFASDWLLIKHALSHRMFHCFHCSEKFPNEIILRTHLSSHLLKDYTISETRDFFCRICGLMVCVCSTYETSNSPMTALVCLKTKSHFQRPQVAKRSSKKFVTKYIASPIDRYGVTLEELQKEVVSLKKRSSASMFPQKFDEKIAKISPEKKSRVKKRSSGGLTRLDIKNNSSTYLPLVSKAKDHSSKPICDYCGEAFDRRSQLNEHMVWHRIKSRDRKSLKRDSEESSENLTASATKRQKLSNNDNNSPGQTIINDESKQTNIEKNHFWYRCFYCLTMKKEEHELNRHVRYYCSVAPKKILRSMLSRSYTLIDLARSGSGKLYDLVHPITKEVLDCIEESEKDSTNGFTKAIGKLAFKCTFCGMKFERVFAVRKHIQSMCHKVNKRVRKMLDDGATLEEVNAVEMCNDLMTDLLQRPIVGDIEDPRENEETQTLYCNKEAEKEMIWSCTACDPSVNFSSEFEYEMHKQSCPKLDSQQELELFDESQTDENDFLLSWKIDDLQDHNKEDDDHNEDVNYVLKASRGNKRVPLKQAKRGRRRITRVNKKHQGKGLRRSSSYEPQDKSAVSTLLLNNNSYKSSIFTDNINASVVMDSDNESHKPAVQLCIDELQESDQRLPRESAPKLTISPSKLDKIKSNCIEDVTNDVQHEISNVTEPDTFSNHARKVTTFSSDNKKHLNCSMNNDVSQRFSDTIVENELSDNDTDFQRKIKNLVSHEDRNITSEPLRSHDYYDDSEEKLTECNKMFDVVDKPRSRDNEHGDSEELLPQLYGDDNSDWNAVDVKGDVKRNSDMTTLSENRCPDELVDDSSRCSSLEEHYIVEVLSEEDFFSLDGDMVLLESPIAEDIEIASPN